MSATAAIAAVENLADRVRRAEQLLGQIAQASIDAIEESSGDRLVRIPSDVLAEIRAHVA